jgi:sec-independent protein translocase protein TatC
MTQNPRTQPAPINRSSSLRGAEQTLIDHLHELRARLFWIVLALILASSAAYVIQDHIMAALMAPLGGQRLVYLTPIGGFNFIFKVSIYFGVGVILPVVVYHLYRFLEPVMDIRRKRSVVLYTVASTLLAVAGGSFAYFASLPAALHFLTGLSIQNVSAMLTVDSYLTFVISYVLGAAALFQIPLILLIINTIKPIPPKKLLSFERFVVLGAFIVAAIISPTPDVTNQAILAVPIILMYQVGVLLVWMQSRKFKNDRPAPEPVGARASTGSIPTPTIQHAPPIQRASSVTSTPATLPVHTRPVVDITRPVRARPVPRHAQPVRPISPRPRYVDGIAPRGQRAPQTS